MSSANVSTRTRILNAAVKSLISGRGSEVRMSDIAKASGISRQALYLHFPTRAELLIALTRHIDEEKDVDSRLAASRAAGTGRERLDAYIVAWGDYIPEIYPVARALLDMRASDDAARAAWDDRMDAMRHGCAAAVDALIDDSNLSGAWERDVAIDMLWSLLSVEMWEHLTLDCGWAQADYIIHIQRVARQTLCGGA